VGQYCRTGLFVTFEGVEGCGKSTQARALKDELSRRGTPVALTREPGGTPLGERIRDILLDTGEAGMTPLAELFLYLASRAEHVERRIRPLLEDGYVVISDRFADASVAYQGGGRGLGAEFVSALNRPALNGVQVDVTFLLDLDPGEGLERLARCKGAEAPDRIESEQLEFHCRVREAYLEAARSEPQRFVVLDAGQETGAITARIVREIDERLGES